MTIRRTNGEKGSLSVWAQRKDKLTPKKEHPRKNENSQKLQVCIPPLPTFDLRHTPEDQNRIPQNTTWFSQFLFMFHSSDVSIESYFRHLLTKSWKLTYKRERWARLVLYRSCRKEKLSKLTRGRSVDRIYVLINCSIYSDLLSNSKLQLEVWL